MEMVQRDGFFRREDPRHLTMCLVNNSWKPAHWFIYGEMADLYDTDPYVAPAPGQASDLQYVIRATETARTACAPRPLWVTTWLGWGSNHCRCVTEDEERVMVYYAVGAGARGINYYIHSSSAGDTAVFTGLYAPALQARKEESEKEAQALWEGAGRINRELERVGPSLATGCPLAVKVTAPRPLWIRAIVSGTRHLILVMVNNDFVATGEQFTQNPLRDARIVVEVPPWLKVAHVVEIRADQNQALEFESSGNSVSFTLPEITSGKMVVLSASSERFDLEPDHERFQEQYRLGSPQISGEPGYIYGVSTPYLWNPTATQYNGLVWCDKYYAKGVESDVKGDFTVRWPVSIAEQDADKPMLLALNFLRVNNPNVVVNVLDSSGTVLHSTPVPTEPSQLVFRDTFVFPQAGEYTLECRQRYTRGSFGQVASSLYLSPEDVVAIPSPPRVLDKASLGVECAFFRPDFPESPTSAGGSLQLYVRNTGSEPIRPSAIYLDDTDLETLIARGQVAWYRLRPELIQPGTCSELSIRLQHLASKDTATVKILVREGWGIQRTVVLAPPPMSIGCAAFSPGLDKLYLHLEKHTPADLTLQQVFLDGADLTSRTAFLSPSFFCNVSSAVVDLPAPLAQGSFHLLHVTAEEGCATACQLRAAKPFFELGTFGNHYFRDYAANHFNTYQSFGSLTREQLDAAWKEGLYVTAPYFAARKAYFYDRLDLSEVQRQVAAVRDHPALLAYYLEDEPDCFDYEYNGVPGSTAMEMRQRADFFVREDPNTLTMCLVNNTFRPANYFTYGQLADLFDTDPYVAPVPQKTSDLTFVREATRLARRASAPHPLFITLWMGWDQIIAAVSRNRRSG
jgi:hypothetical protein